MKEKIKKNLEKYPLIYHFVRKFYWKIQTLRARIFGTKLIEKEWINHLPGNFDQIFHPHRKFLIERISLFNPQSVLEIGCGWGPNLFLLAEKFPQIKITGIDINPGSIKLGKEIFKNKEIKNIELKHCKMDALVQFLDKSFDIVLTDASLMCIGPDRIREIIKEIFRVAKKAIILVEWHIKNKEEYDAHVGVWRRDYISLLEEIIPEAEINLTKITPEMWPDENWQKFGYIIEVRL